ncbi:LOW QUALITY PROTEIN: uncharacterized protein LOC103928290 [Pyrus x bretschneideri]|uniref:LOW QUALITY PROTEIN: uncharacterized protein LOC103928290 n=1 Tax=Pyrus x bretschneideri TaxID=225117 RepID=UPI0020300C5E|nr:LOW QUALITY PROTEIN: uncharacterized protein LOC103928290 [Pyrus x bretschneideri]
MGALAPFSQWIPADDILLKKAVEDGASLESLAKGAVHFSRRFTVRELQDRWYSLLYDPVVSEDASARMIEFESSTTTVPFDRTGNSKGKKCESGKRKAESVCSSYYAMRKRICNEPFNSMGLNFLVAPGNNNYDGNGDEPLYGNSSDMDAMQNLMDVGTDDTFHMLQNPDGNDFHMEQGNIHEDIMTWNESKVDEFNHPEGLPDCSLFNADDIGMKPLFTLDQINGNEGNMCTEFEGNKAFNSPVSNTGALFNNLEYSSPLPAMPVDVDLREHDICTSDSFELHENIDANKARTTEDDAHIGMEVATEMPCCDFQSSAAPVCNEGYLAELSNSLLNFTNEELMLVTADGKDVIDKSYYDGLSSLLLSSPKRIPNADEHIVCHSDTPMLSSSTASNYQNPELRDGFICCTLNTEDPEIPCNGDIFLPNRSSTSEGNKPISLCTSGFPVNKRNNHTGPCFMHKERKNLGEPHSTSQIKGSHFLQEKGRKSPLGNFGVKFELSDVPSDVASKNAGHVGEGLGQIDSANPSTSVQPGILKEGTRESMSEKHLSYNSTEFHVENPDSGVIKRSLIHQLQLGTIYHYIRKGCPCILLNQIKSRYIGSAGAFESDDDIPCYSDIEAMVLDMDLDPDDQDLCSSEEVSKYQDEDAKRRIIRLEQCAYSYLQRAIASHGAFAILYGRHSKHYIKKSQVLLGRATDDSVVDIDLGRDGRGNKISRKQAMINMDKDGSFHLKNLGKCSISVNSKEVAPRQSLSLSSSCLIEIRGMPFIFEMNQTRVKQYLESIPQ